MSVSILKKHATRLPRIISAYDSGQNAASLELAAQTLFCASTGSSNRGAFLFFSVSAMGVSNQNKATAAARYLSVLAAAATAGTAAAQFQFEIPSEFFGGGGGFPGQVRVACLEWGVCVCSQVAVDRLPIVIYGASPCNTASAIGS
jgi:fatty acid desaturase